MFGGDEPNFPGLLNEAELYSAVSRGSGTLRSTFGAGLVNEVRLGISNAPVWFADQVDLTQFTDQAGFNIGFPNVGIALTNATTNAAPSSRNGKSFNLDDSVNWLKGNHTLQFGASFSRISGWMKAQTLVPGLTLGVDTTNDPANAMFNPTNFPGAANADLNNARNLYALLTGRITAINSNARLDGTTGQYVYLGVGRTREHQDEVGLFVQDSWRLRQNLTLNAGLRWQIAFPFQADDSVYSRNTMADLCGISGPGDGPGGRECNLFNPGVFNPGAQAPVYDLYTAGSPGYETEYDNFAPNVGVAWQPNVSEGWLRTLLGDPSQATIRASYGVSYNSDGLGVLPGRLRRQSRQPDHDEPHDDERAIPAGPPRRVVAGAVATAGTPRTVVRDSGRAQLSDGDRLQQRRESLSSEFQDAVRSLVFDRAPAHGQPADGH